MKKYFVFLVTITVIFASCSNEESEELSGTTDNSQKEIAEFASTPLIYDKIYQIRDGKEIDLTHTQNVNGLTKATSNYEFYEFSPTVLRYIYLGSVLQDQSIINTTYRPVGFLNALKEKITISFSLPVKSREIVPSKSAFEDAITDVVADKNFTGLQSQIFTYKMKQFSYYSEVKLAFGANVNIGSLFGVDTQINSDKINRNTAIFVDFSQIYFSTYMDIPDDGNIFRTEAIRQSYLSQKPTYIHTVDFGRKGVILVESKESHETLSVAIRASFNAKIVNGTLSIDANTKKILDEAFISICIFGGDGNEATKTIGGFNNFQDFIIKGGVYTKQVYGVPISFGAAYASDNSMYVSEIQVKR